MACSTNCNIIFEVLQGLILASLLFHTYICDIFFEISEEISQVILMATLDIAVAPV